MASRKGLSLLALASMFMAGWSVGTESPSLGQEATPADDLFGEPLAEGDDASAAEDLFGPAGDTPDADDPFGIAPAPAEADDEDEFSEFAAPATEADPLDDFLAVAPPAASVEESLRQLKEQLAAIDAKIDALIKRQNDQAREFGGGMGMRRGGPVGRGMDMETTMERGMGRGEMMERGGMRRAGGEFDFERGMGGAMGRGGFVGEWAPNPSPPATRVTWEYLDENFSQPVANRRGKEGWEMVNVFCVRRWTIATKASCLQTTG